METLEAKKARLKVEEEAEKAEFWQSIKALYIPLFLFISCCIFAAGAFVLYNSESEREWGLGLITVSALIAISAFVCLFKFHNPLREKGFIHNKSDEEI